MRWRLYSFQRSPGLRSRNSIRKQAMVQTDLNHFGFSLQVDGLFEDETEAAVHQFQLEFLRVSCGG